jgi:CubicO group peptidase (beta-lactamase class C family)
MEEKWEYLTKFILLAVLVGVAASGKVTTLAASPSGQEPALRLSDPIDEVVADLEDYIPERMREGDVPGLAIALIRDGEVVWTEGFGVANTITREPVRPETAFEVASNSKVVTAYTALRLVEEGKLS